MGMSLIYSVSFSIKEILKPTERAPNGQNRKNLSNKIHKITLDYDPDYETNIHESILM
jgi:hypothetical protein